MSTIRIPIEVVRSSGRREVPVRYVDTPRAVERVLAITDSGVATIRELILLLAIVRIIESGRLDGKTVASNRFDHA